MALKNKISFEIRPEPISSDQFIKGIPDGSIFSYYDGKYYLNNTKIVPWEVYNVTKYLPTKQEVLEYSAGAMWIRERGKWIYVGPFILGTNSSGTTPVGPCGIGCMIIENNFIIT